MQGQQMMTAPQQTMAAPNFSSTNPYYNQQTAQLQRGMYPNKVQQQQQQFPNQMAQMQWSQQQQGSNNTYALSFNFSRVCMETKEK